MGNLFGDDAALSGDAVISDCGRYRYSLTRRWGDGPRIVFVMLNPSTADSAQDDPTIRRCIGFAKREGCGSIEVVNLWALRATDPVALWDEEHELDQTNAEHIRRAAERASRVVVAWGATVGQIGSLHEDVADEVLELLAACHVKPYCLGVTKDGHPRHPLYVRADAPLRRFPEAANA